MKALFRGLILTISMVACAQESEPIPMELDPLALDVVETAGVLDAPRPLDEEEETAEE